VARAWDVAHPAAIISGGRRDGDGRQDPQKKAARAVVAVMMGKGLASAEMRELIHLLKHAAHQV
jgi:hypothetical protein